MLQKFAGGETRLRLVIGVASLAVLLVFWEGFAHFGLVDPRFSSRPSRIVVAAANLLVDREFWMHVRVSFLEFIAGLIAACVVGIPLGIAMGWIRRLRLLLEPIVMVFYSVPRTTFLPLIIL
ncbi:MAG: hypothetical protein FJX52_17090, partial [Alphaproteobacteria bacterium]|nr:hypothetical protein [Alphaproteobacteria bacterium]